MEEAFAKMQKAAGQTEMKAPEIDFESVLAQKLKKLPKLAEDSINLQLQKLGTSKDVPEKVLLYKSISEIWDQNLAAGPSAYYKEQVDIVQPSYKNCITAAEQYYIAGKVERDSTLHSWYSSKAANLYQKAIELEKDSLSAKVGLAKTNIELKNEVMKGVFMLRDVVAADSTHSEANLVLGRLSVFSKQYDKAIKRLENVVKWEPKNTEALYYLGEAYYGLGDREKALANFEKCKSLVESPAFKKELDKYIESIIVNY